LLLGLKAGYFEPEWPYDRHQLVSFVTKCWDLTSKLDQFGPKLVTLRHPKRCEFLMQPNDFLFKLSLAAEESRTMAALRRRTACHYRLR
jgi:hypothetical protein